MSSSNLPGFLPRDPRVEEPYRLTSQTALRIAILGAIAIALFAALFLRLWALQVICGERYLLEAQNNQVRSARVEASRGTIVDRNGNLLVSNQAATSVQLWPATIRELPPAEVAAMFRKLAPAPRTEGRRDPEGDEEAP